MEHSHLRPSPATVIAFVALVVSLAGVAYALEANSVRSRHIVNGQVKKADLADGSVIGPKVADGAITAPKIGAGEVGSSQVADGSITPAKIGQIPAVRASSPSESVNNDQILEPGEEPVVFDEEKYDTASMHTAGVPVDDTGSRFVAPRAGVYAIDAGLIFSDPAFAAGEGTFRQLALKPNGDPDTIDIIAASQVVPDADAEVMNVSGTTVLQAGEYVELYAAHDAGGNISTPQSQFGLVGDNRHFFAMTWLGPAS